MSFLINSYIFAGLDPDAQAFITAAGITNPTQQQAINTLVIDLKGYGIWNKMKAIYPFVGGTASTHKWNLKDPRDLDAAFRLVFTGGWTHSNTGALPNGTNGYADTFLIPSTNYSVINSVHISSYIRNSSQGVLLGTDSTYRLWISPNFNGSNKYFELNTTTATARTPISTNLGLWIGNRLTTDIAKLFNQGILNDSYSSVPNGRDTKKIYLASRNTTTGSASNYSSSQIAFSSIGDGLTDTEASNLYTAVQAYQTTLGRSIGTQTVSDADAQAFVTAANIQDQVQADAVNNLTIGLKADGLWSKMKAIYPFVGGDAASHKFNLKNPLDTDAAFRLVFNGGWTHNSLGVTQGANGYADTKINPFGFTANDVHFSLYQRLNTTSGNDCFGARNGTGTESIRWIVKAAATTTSYLDINGDVNRITTTVADSRGLFIASRINSTSLKAYRNNTILATRTNTNTGGNPNYNLYLGALNQTNSATNYSAQNFAFLSFGDGLTDTEAANLYSRVQTYQTALNRQV